MSWSDGVDRATGYIVSAVNWNALLGAAGSLMQLKSHAHGGTTGEGSQSLGPLVRTDFTDATAPAAPGAGLTRLYAVAAHLRFRAGAAGADSAIIDGTTTAAGDLAGTYPNPTVRNITVGSDADGDLYYRSGGTLVRLPKGAALVGLRMNAGGTAPEWASLVGITLATEQPTTSGTFIDFTGIPAGARRVTVMLQSVSTNGTSPYIVQLGDSGGIETSGYVGSTAQAATAWSAGIRLHANAPAIAINLLDAVIVLTLKDASDNTWMATVQTADTTNTDNFWGVGHKALSATLDRVRLTTINGTDTFDAGSVNISYE